MSEPIKRPLHVGTRHIAGRHTGFTVVDAKGHMLGTYKEEKAHAIVRELNAYPKLLAALREAQEAVDDAVAMCEIGPPPGFRASHRARYALLRELDGEGT